MSGAFACVCSTAGLKTMADPLILRLRRSVQLLMANGKPSWPRDGRLSRAERLEIIAAAGTSECSAWIFSMLERGDLNEEPSMVKRIC